MVADTPNVGTPRNHAIIRGKVFGPQEALLAKFNSVGHKVEHGDPDGHLYQHGQATAHGAHAILRVERHHSLLLLHRILLVGILLAEFIDFGFEHTHLGTAQETLTRGNIDDEAEQDGNQQEYDTHRQAQAGQEVEDVEREEAVDPLEKRPTEINQFLHL